MTQPNIGGPRITPATNCPTIKGNPNLLRRKPTSQETDSIRSILTISSALNILNTPFLYRNIRLLQHLFPEGPAGCQPACKRRLLVDILLHHQLYHGLNGKILPTICFYPVTKRWKARNIIIPGPFLKQYSGTGSPDRRQTLVPKAAKAAGIMALIMDSPIYIPPFDKFAVIGMGFPQSGETRTIFLLNFVKIQDQLHQGKFFRGISFDPTDSAQALPPDLINQKKVRRPGLFILSGPGRLSNLKPGLILKTPIIT